MKFEEKRARLIQYLYMKITEGDWHGVSDAANDLRELEAEWKVERKLLPYKEAYEALGSPATPGDIAASYLNPIVEKVNQAVSQWGHKPT
jgi:hypothetical protein